MNRQILILSIIASAAGFLLTTEAKSRSTGILPSTGLSLTRNAAATCGNCHSGTIGGPQVSLVPASRALTPGQTVSVRLGATGGAPGSRGGFAADASRGQWIAGVGTRTSASGAAITHSSPATRTWQLSYRASTTPGPVELYTVVNTVNGDGKTRGDQWAFHGATSTAAVSTPVRLYVNAPGVVPIGSGCADGYGNVAVYGAPEAPTLGNSRFRLEAIGLPPNARTMFILGLQRTMPSIDMTMMGAPGCFLHSDIRVSVFLTSTGGDASRAEGRLTMPVPIPNSAALKGFFFRTQIGAIDARSARGFPVVFTNGLGITIQ